MTKEPTELLWLTAAEFHALGLTAFFREELDGRKDILTRYRLRVSYHCTVHLHKSLLHTHPNRARVFDTFDNAQMTKLASMAQPMVVDRGTVIVEQVGQQHTPHCGEC